MPLPAPGNQRLRFPALLACLAYGYVADIDVYALFDVGMYILCHISSIFRLHMTFIRINWRGQRAFDLRIGGTKMLKSNGFLIAAVSALTLIVVVACGGAADEPTAAESSQPAMQPQAATDSAPPMPSLQPVQATVVATPTPLPTNTPTAAQESVSVGGRLRIASIPPVQQLL